MNETHEKKQGDDHDEPVKAKRNGLYHASNMLSGCGIKQFICCNNFGIKRFFAQGFLFKLSSTCSCVDKVGNEC